MKVYRVEHPDGLGIWYNKHGGITFRNPLESLDKCAAAAAPMPLNKEFYNYQGKQWFASAAKKDALQLWFSARNIVDLEKLGYEVCEYTIKNNTVRMFDKYEATFSMDNVTERKVLDPSKIYGMEYTQMKGFY